MTLNTEIKYRYQSATITTATAALIFLLLYLIPYSFTKPPKPEEEMGMLVNLGDSEDGSGNVQPMSDADKTEQSNAKATSSSSTQLPDAVNTQDHEDAPSVETPKKDNPTIKPIKKKPIDNPKPDPSKIEADRIAKELAENKAKAEATRNKLKGMLNHSNSSKSEGDGKGSGDKGVVDGDPNGKVYAGENTGLGNAGGGTDFRGKIAKRVKRRINVTENSNEEGNVAINIKVDAEGNVIAAKFTEKNSTTSSAHLRSVALKAAREMKFSPKPEADEETGTVIFKFRNR